MMPDYIYKNPFLPSGVDGVLCINLLYGGDELFLEYILLSAK